MVLYVACGLRMSFLSSRGKHEARADSMNRYLVRLLSPAAPALLLLFGLVFGFAFAHLAGMKWSPIATRLYYLGLLFWGGAVLVCRWKRRGQLVISDSLFLTFVLLVAGSLAVHWEASAAVAYYAKMLPFLVLLPYVLGRLVDASDFSFFVRALPWLGFLLLLLCVADFWLVPNPEEVLERWTFFGLNHAPLLIAQVLSAAMLVQVHIALRPEVAPGSGAGNHVIAWTGLGLMAIGLVMIAARGSLIGAALTMTLLMFLIPGSWRRKILLVVYLAIATVVAFNLLPAQQSEFYSRLKTLASSDPTQIPNTGVEGRAAVSALPSGVTDSGPVTRRDGPRCQPLAAGFNSVAIRRVLYQEAIALSIQYPLAGVGAGNFGKYSCGGEGVYPHSTVLQAFAELGVAGGSLLLTLIAISLLNFWRGHASSPAAASEAALWLALLAFFTLSDQIYGSYFMAAASFFLFGVAASLRMRYPPFAHYNEHVKPTP